MAEILSGRPLLHHAIASVRELANEVVVVAPVGIDPPVPLGVRVVHDDIPFEGPLVGLVVGLRASTADRVLVVAGDMPSLVLSVASALIDELSSGASAAVLEQASRARPLPMSLQRIPALKRGEDLVGAGERRLRALVDVLEAVVIPEPEWRALDPEGRSVIDIDTPKDLP